MGKVIEFKTRGELKEENVTLKLLQMADDIDAVILRHLSDPDIDPRELVGVLSHRLGTLMNHLEEKAELWYVCQKVMKKQAQLD
jgi:hypothetical protein